MEKIGVLLIATGKYISFFKQFYDSSEKYFLCDYEKVYFLFTDSTDTQFPENVKVIHQSREEWPGPTLHRYHYFLNSKRLIQSYNTDYLFYSDVDMRFCNTVGPEILGSDFLCVLHPGFYNIGNPRGTPENRMESMAYIPLYKPIKYIAGGFQGGKTYYFLDAMRTMRNAIDTDAKNGIVPVWHDESMWNKYISSNSRSKKILTPEYCFPERWVTAPNLRGLTPRLLALDKNHSEMRS